MEKLKCYYLVTAKILFKETKQQQKQQNNNKH